MNEYFEKFLANSKDIAHRVNHDANLKDKVIEALNSHQGYTPIVAGEIGLKIRKRKSGLIEATVNADLYKPGFPVSPFIVMIEGILNTSKSAYLMMDYSEVISFDINRTKLPIPLLKDPVSLRVTVESLVKSYPDFYKPILDYMINKGYHFNFEGVRCFGCTSHRNPDFRIVLHDLDCMNMTNYKEILKGLSNKGNFKRLSEYSKRLVRLNG